MSTVIIILMLKSLFLIILIGGFSFLYTDIESSSLLFSLFLPIVDFLVLIALGFWFVALFHKTGVNQSSSGSDGTGFLGGDGDGDGGGC